MSIVTITTEELDHVVNLFKISLEKEFKGKNQQIIDTNKIIKQFENVLRQKMQIIPSIKEEREEQDIKNEIEKLQRKALRLKAKLHEKRSSFIEDIRHQTEKTLEEKRPQLNLNDLENDIIIPEQINSKIDHLDLVISKLKQQIYKEKGSIEEKIEKYEPFLKDSFDFINNLN